MKVWTRTYITYSLTTKMKKGKRFLLSALNTIKDPDEIWSTTLKGKVQQVYIRYYDNCPVVVRFKEGSVYSMHSLLKNGSLNEERAINLRKGILIHKKS